MMDRLLCLVRHDRIGIFAVDEAHCVSQWVCEHVWYFWILWVLCYFLLHMDIIFKFNGSVCFTFCVASDYIYQVCRHLIFRIYCNDLITGARLPPCFHKTWQTQNNLSYDSSIGNSIVFVIENDTLPVDKHPRNFLYILKISVLYFLH